MQTFRTDTIYSTCGQMDTEGEAQRDAQRQVQRQSGFTQGTSTVLTIDALVVLTDI